MKRDFISIADWTGEELKQMIDLSREMKKYPAKFRDVLKGKSVALIFEKQSLRTHVTFDVGVSQLGAHAVYLTQADISLGTRETIPDTAKNLERWVDGVVLRTFAHSNCTNLAAEMKVPLINALSDFEHPCQAVGDFQTLYEKFGDVKGRKFVWMGDGNNVCHSLMLFAAKLGMDFIACTPRGYEPDPGVYKLAAAAARESGAHLDLIHHPKEAAKHADVLYTDVWASMGQEKEKEKRAADFADFQINGKLMSYAKPTALFMHCLPAHRNEEVTDEVMDSTQSVVFDEAENRLHSCKAVMMLLMGGD